MNKRFVIGAVVFVLFVGAAVFFFGKERENQVAQRVTNFQECVEAGFPVMESYPEQCSNSEETFTRDIGNALEKADLIRVSTPRPGDQIIAGETYELSGEARGYWFFEATFPFEIVTEDGEELFSYYATAEGEWMTEEFVSFNAEFTVPTEYEGPATLILRRSNASGLSEHDDELTVPIVIRSNSPAETVIDQNINKEPKIEPKDPGEGRGDQVVAGGCFVGGCSSQICSEEPDAISTCEWREEYQCYQSARCERQPSGQCGWTQTTELAECLSNSGASTM
jgi:hypothetical protein